MLRSAADDNLAMKISVAILAAVSLLGLVGASSASSPVSAPLIAYWNGTSWTQQEAPNPDSSASLTAITAVSATDVWALGSYGYSTSPTADGFTALAEHWDGASWQQVAMPTPAGSSEVHLYGVTALSSSDIWAVGSWADFGPGDGLVPLIEHWDGSAWSIVPSPVLPQPVVDHGAQLHGVTAVASDDVWAVGYVGTGTQRPLILHWDGTSWMRVPAPRNGSQSVLSGVTALSPTKVWAVGTLHVKHGKQRAQGFALRWNGKVWQQMPNVHAGNLLAVAGTKNDVWAVGGWSNGGGPGRTLIEHWNGRHWKNFQGRTGFPESIRQPLISIAMLPGDELWAVGYHADEHSLQSQTLLEHFSGGAWSPVDSMNPARNDWFASVAAASPTDVWAVGTYFPDP